MATPKIFRQGEATKSVEIVAPQPAKTSAPLSATRATPAPTPSPAVAPATSAPQNAPIAKSGEIVEKLVKRDTIAAVKSKSKR